MMSSESTRATAAPDPEAWAVIDGNGKIIETSVHKWAVESWLKYDAARKLVPLFGNLLAARDPAPVSRELDVEAERRASYARIVPDKIVEQIIEHYKYGVEAGKPYVMDDTLIFRSDFAQAYEIGLREEVNRQATAESAPASAAPDEHPKRIPRENNDKLIELARYWKLDGDWMTCKGCKRSLIASRDGEALGHASGCKLASQQHPWAQLRALIAPSNSSPVGAKESDQ